MKDHDDSFSEGETDVQYSDVIQIGSGQTGSSSSSNFGSGSGNGSGSGSGSEDGGDVSDALIVFICNILFLCYSILWIPLVIRSANL